MARASSRWLASMRPGACRTARSSTWCCWLRMPSTSRWPPAGCRPAARGAVRAGAPLPDIHSEEVLRQTVLAAGRIGHSTGPSGVALVRLFRRWGIADALHQRMVQAPPGVPVGALIAAGAAELGFQQHSELLHVPGIHIVGPLPPALQINTTFSAAVGAQSLQGDAARALLAYLASPLAQDAKRRQGMEPA